MNVLIVHTIVVALLGMGQRPAQQAAPDVLSIPASKVLRCRLTGGTTAFDSLTVEFEIGRVTDSVTRDLQVTFDSTGRPLDLTDFVTFLDREHGASMHSAFARMSDSSVTGFTVIHERKWSRPEERFAPVPKGSMRGRYFALSETQRQGARALAAWVWGHRCP